MSVHRLFTAFVVLAGFGLWLPVPVALAEAPAHLPYRAVEVAARPPSEAWPNIPARTGYDDAWDPAGGDRAMTAGGGPGGTPYLLAIPDIQCVASVTVSSIADSGAGSLRQAIADVCSGGTIDFAAGLAVQTITLTSTELTIAKTVTITNPNAPGLAISGNNARRVFYISSGVVTLSHLSIISGTAGYGGGIRNDGTLSVVNSTLSGNSAGTSGGGIYNYNSSTLSVVNSTLSGNSATSGGGGGIFNGSGSTLSVVNSTLAGNSAPAGYGGGILNGGTLNLANTLIAHSSGGDCSNYFGAVGANDHNLIESTGYACGLTNGAGGSIIGRNPLLAPLGDYGGQTQTFALLPGSPAIDAGTNTGCPAADQRGIAHSFGSSCDIGAVEAQGFTLAKTGGDNQSAPINTAFTSPLSLTVSSSASEPVDGGQVIFTGPGSGAGISPRVYTVTISGGAVTQVVTANTTVGSYVVTATARGNLGDPISYNLTNTLPAVTLSVSAGSGTEADQTIITVTATVSVPVVGNQTVTLGVTGTGITTADYSLSNTTITILNGQSSGSVAFTIQDDAVAEGPEIATLTLGNPSAGIGLGSPISQDVTISDNDTAGYTFSANDFSLSEGSSQAITVTLHTLPAAEVTLNLSSSNPAQCTVSPASVTLNAGNWQSGAGFTVSGVSDSLNDGDQPCAIVTTASSADSVYSGLNPADISLTVEDQQRLYLPLILKGQ